MSQAPSDEDATKVEGTLSQDGSSRVRKEFFLALTAAFVSLQLLFFGNMLYMHASQFKSTQRYHNLKMLFVDGDGSVLGQALLDAYHQHMANDFPTMHSEPADMYPTLHDARQAVCNGGYWAAIYAHNNASSDLVSSMTQGDRQKVGVSYVWNSVLWPPFTESGIHAKILLLLKSARQAYYTRNASSVIRDVDITNRDALNSFLNPLRIEEINILPTEQGARILYNTVSMVMPIIQQFFFMVAMNSVADRVQLYTQLGWQTVFLLRTLVTYAFTLATALFMAGYFWAYKEEWNVNFGQYVLSVLILWVYAHIHSLMVDIGTAFLPLTVMPFCVLTWIIMNVTSTVAPLEISPGLFKWGYMLPGRATYETLLQVWSRGCDNHLSRTLPVLFGWEIIGSLVAPWGILHRCQEAVMAKQLGQAELQAGSSGVHAVNAVGLSRDRSVAVMRDIPKEQFRMTSQRSDGLAEGSGLLNRQADRSVTVHQDRNRQTAAATPRQHGLYTVSGEPTTGRGYEGLAVPRFSFEYRNTNDPMGLRYDEGLEHRNA